MKPSLGYKRKSISDKQINDILKLYKEFEINEISQIFDNSEFGYVRITIERPQIIHHDLLDNNHKASLEHLSKHIPDPKLRDYEYVPLNENIDQYFQHEVVPYVPDVCIDNSTRNNIGYEIPCKKYFYKYKSIMSIVDIDNDLKKLHKEIIKQIEELRNEHR
jgi:type I restriction enzyme M protein